MITRRTVLSSAFTLAFKLAFAFAKRSSVSCRAGEPQGRNFHSYLVKSVEECGGEQCPQAPQFFKVGTLHEDLVGIEVHQDDAHGFGSWDAVVRFVQMLKTKVKLKGGEPLDYGVSYAHLKRVRVHEKNRTLIYPNSNYLDTAVALLGLDGCKPAPTPSTPTFLDDVHSTEAADEQNGAIYRSAFGSLLFYTLDVPDAQYVTNTLAQVLRNPTVEAFAALKRLVRYLSGTRERAIELRSCVCRLVARVLRPDTREWCTVTACIFTFLLQQTDTPRYLI